MLTVGVSGFICAESQKAGLGVATAIRAAFGRSIKIVGLDSYPISPILGLSNLLDLVAPFPDPALGPDTFLAAAAKLKDAHGLDILIPCGDEEIAVVGSISKSLRDLGILTLTPDLGADGLTLKMQLARSARSLPVLVPRTEVIKSEDQFNLIKNNMQYPVVVKGPLRGALFALSQREAEIWVRTMARTSGYPLLLQEFVAGPEYSIAALADENCELVGTVAILKLGITEQGKTWAGQTIDDPQLVDIAARLAQGLQLKGPFEVELIRPTVGQRTLDYVIEVNPRFPAWIMFGALGGTNLPMLLVELLSRSTGVALFGDQSTKVEEPENICKIFMKVDTEVFFEIDAMGQLISADMLKWEGS